MENEHNMQSEFLTTQETADRLRVSPGTVRNLIKAGELHAVKFGRTVRIHRDELERFIESKIQTDGKA